MLVLRSPVLELKVKLVPDLGGKLPVAAVTNKTLQLVSVLSSATVTLVALVALVAFVLDDLRYYYYYTVLIRNHCFHFMLLLKTVSIDGQL